MGTRSRDLILQTAKERRWLNLSCSWLCAFSWQRLSTDNRWMRKEWEHAVLMKTLAVNRFCMLVNNATVIHMMILLTSKLADSDRIGECCPADDPCGEQVPYACKQCNCDKNDIPWKKMEESEDYY